MKGKPTKIDLEISSNFSGKGSPQQLVPKDFISYSKAKIDTIPLIQALEHQETFDTKDGLIEQRRLSQNTFEDLGATTEDFNKEDGELKGSTSAEALKEEDCGRERLKRHRVEVAGSIWIPETWGQEELLKDWIDCSAFDASLSPNGIMLARASLVGEERTSNSDRLRIENRF